jgi:putative endonuclease
MSLLAVRPRSITSSVGDTILSRIRSLAQQLRGRAQPKHLVRGELGEDLAATHLRKHGYKILVRRYRPKSRRGDIDIVAREGEVLVFVEVKTRSSEDFGRPVDAVGPQKRRHLRRAALDYLRRLGSPRLYFRFDVVEVILDEGGKKAKEVRLLRNVFDLGEVYRY